MAASATPPNQQEVILKINLQTNPNPQTLMQTDDFVNATAVHFFSNLPTSQTIPPNLFTIITAKKWNMVIFGQGSKFTPTAETINALAAVGYLKFSGSQQIPMGFFGKLKKKATLNSIILDLSNDSILYKKPLPQRNVVEWQQLFANNLAQNNWAIILRNSLEKDTPNIVGLAKEISGNRLRGSQTSTPPIRNLRATVMDMYTREIVQLVMNLRRSNEFDNLERIINKFTPSSAEWQRRLRADQSCNDERCSDQLGCPVSLHLASVGAATFKKAVLAEFSATSSDAAAGSATRKPSKELTMLQEEARQLVNDTPLSKSVVAAEALLSTARARVEDLNLSYLFEIFDNS